ncbi:MAG: MFS transporter [Chloroflexi bacterium]|nr:MFS transporter [Chloroflexota bacterium]
MGVDALAALIFGRLYDRHGLSVLIGVAFLSAFFAPLVFTTSLWAALAGMVVWGVSMGAQESVMRAAVAGMVSPDRRGSAYGVFNTGYGLAWFAGSALMGVLYDISLPALIAFSVLSQLAAVPVLYRLTKQESI